MKARVKEDSKLDNIFAFSGLEFTKMAWRDVPEGFEDEARTNPYLELQEEAKAKTKAETKAEAKASAKESAMAEGPQSPTSQEKPSEDKPSTGESFMRRGRRGKGESENEG